MAGRPKRRAKELEIELGIVDAPRSQLEQWKRLKALEEKLDKHIVANRPPRERPWHKQARPDQLPPPGNTWQILLIMSGRGWGKTRVGSEWIAEQAVLNPETEWAIVAPTWRACQKACIEGKSGLLKALFADEIEAINMSDLQIRLTNGSRIYGYSADRPDRLRGANLSGAWIDELCSIKKASDLLGEALMPALRIGEYPRLIITTTPRPQRALKELLARTDGTVHVVRGSIWDNAANLSAAMLADMRARFEGTRMGRQELMGELIDDVEGALWTRDNLEDTGVLNEDEVPELVRVVVGIDPAVTSAHDSDDTGIIVVGRGRNGHLYVLEDASLKASPHSCMHRAVKAYKRHKADFIVGEVNNGGDYIRDLLRTVDMTIPYKSVNATRGKLTRAQPIAALWEQKRAHIVGSMPELEDQLCSWTPDSKDSPDKLDALVWSCHELNTGSSALAHLHAISKMCSHCDTANRKRDNRCVKCGSALTIDLEAIVTA